MKCLATLLKLETLLCVLIITVYAGVVYAFVQMLVHRYLDPSSKHHIWSQIARLPLLRSRSGSPPPVVKDKGRLEMILGYLNKWDAGPEIPENDRIGPEYLCCHPTVAEHLRECVKSIASYMRKTRPQRPLNIFLSAPPGSGKSTLAKGLKIAANTAACIPTTAASDVRTFDLTTYSSPDKLVEDIKRFIDNKERQEVVPLVFLDEFDSRIRDWQPFRRFLLPMCDGRFSLSEQKHDLGKCIFVFAASLEVIDRDALVDCAKRAAGKLGKYALTKVERRPGVSGYYDQLVHDLLHGNRRYPNPQKWFEHRTYVLEAYRAQRSIVKCRDFFDRIDFFLHVPSDNDYFADRPKEASAPAVSDRGGCTADGSETPLYFADKEIIRLILLKIRDYYGRKTGENGNLVPWVTKVEKKALFALACAAYPSRREMERRIFAATCTDPAYDAFSFSHLGKDAKESYRKAEEELTKKKEWHEPVGYLRVPAS